MFMCTDVLQAVACVRVSIHIFMNVDQIIIIEHPGCNYKIKIELKSSRITVIAVGWTNRKLIETLRACP